MDLKTETTLAVGQTLAIDGWSWPTMLEDADDFDGAEFRIWLGNARVALPVRVEITGRKVRWDAPIHGAGVRVRVTFLQDGDEGDETTATGWMSWKELQDGSVQLNPTQRRLV